MLLCDTYKRNGTRCNNEAKFLASKSRQFKTRHLCPICLLDMLSSEKQTYKVIAC